MNPEGKIRQVVDRCADCDICRYLMETTCHLFPELYRLFDREVEAGEKITSEDLRHLVDLYNFCVVCPCPNIRADIMQAKTAFIDRDGLKFSIRILEDVERIGRFCGAYSLNQSKIHSIAVEWQGSWDSNKNSIRRPLKWGAG